MNRLNTFSYNCCYYRLCKEHLLIYVGPLYAVHSITHLPCPRTGIQVTQESIYGPLRWISNNIPSKLLPSFLLSWLLPFYYTNILDK